MFNEWGCCGQLLMNCGHGEKAQRIGQIRYYTDCVCLYTYTWKHSLLALVFVYVNYIFVSYTITILKLTVIKGHYLFCILFVLFLFIPLCVCLFIYRLLFFFLYWFLWLYIFFTIWFIWVFFRKTDAFWQFVHLFVFMNCHKAVIAPGWESNYRHHSPQHFPIPPKAFPGYISTPFDTKKQQVCPRGWAVSHCSAI